MPSRDQSLDDLDRLAAEALVGMREAIRRVSKAAADAARGVGGPTQMVNATKGLAAEIADAVTLANLTGRARTIEAARSVAGEALELGLLPPEQIPIPQAGRGLTQSARALLKREPLLAESAAEVPALIESGAFTAARASTQEIADRVHKAIADSLATGDPTATTARILADTEAWTDAYAETVVRTNQSRAYTDGVTEMAEKPGVRAVTPAFRYDATRDSATRPNHRAGDGLIMATDDPAWRDHKPPFGFNCRCVISLVTRSQLSRMGLINEDTGDVVPHFPRGFAAHVPDEGFISGGV